MTREMSISDLAIARDERVAELEDALRSLLNQAGANADMLKWSVAVLKARKVLGNEQS